MLSIRRPLVRMFVACLGLAVAGPALALVSDPYVNGQTPGAVMKEFDFAAAKFAEHPSFRKISKGSTGV